MKINLIIIGILICHFSFSQKTDYLFYVKTHCDNLLKYGHDTYGDRNTDMFASVIDTRDMTVPKTGVPPTEGTRASDRAVGGSNYYHDIETIKVLEELSKITRNPKYHNEAVKYTRDFLKYCQNQYTGLLGWGEHLYYNFFQDTITAGSIEKPLGKRYHEFLEETPSWQYLWNIDSLAVIKAISGLRYHFRSFNTQSFLYNRHATWHEVKKKHKLGLEQFQEGGQPWIKHSGIQCYSFAFLLDKTHDQYWTRWVEGSGSLYWNYRNPETNLTLSCIDDPRPGSQIAAMGSMAQLSYFLLKAWEQYPAKIELRERAEVIFKAITKLSWDNERKGYLNNLNLDGSISSKQLVPVITTGYGAFDIMTLGRIAAYFYTVTGDKDYKIITKRISEIVLNEFRLPEGYVINSLASIIQFALDSYEVTDDKRMLKLAEKYADTGIKQLWSGKMFVRISGDPYYESKLNTSSLLLGFVRLHYINKNQDSSILEWAM